VRQKQLDNELSGQQTLLGAEVELAKATGQKVDLAEREKDIAEITAAKSKAEADRLRQEQTLAFFKLLQGFLAQTALSGGNPTGAITQAITALGLIGSVVGSFKEGGFIETGGFTPNIGENVGMFAEVHGGEYVGTAKQVRKYPDLFEAINNERRTGILDLPKMYGEAKNDIIVMPTQIDPNEIAKAIGNEVREAMREINVTEYGLTDNLHLVQTVRKNNQSVRNIFKPKNCI
jgi:hypothetical protein